MRPLLGLFVVVWIAAGISAWRHRGRPEPELPIAAATPPAEEALRWLARHQSADGPWSATRFYRRCHGERCTGIDPAGDDIVLTSFALLAFTGRGYTPQNRSSYVDAHTGETVRFGTVVRKGLKYLVDHEDAWIARGPKDPFLDRSALATLALSEAYGITNAVAYRGPTGRAIAAIESSRLPGGAFAGDFEVTLHAAMALKSAQISGIAISSETVAALASWGRGAPASSGKHPTELAARILVRVFFAKAKPTDEEVDRLLADPPRWDDPAFDHWYVSTLAIFQADGPSGRRWRKWERALEAVLAQHQARDGCAEGSWERSNGRVLDTALGSLMLGTYWGPRCVFGPGK